MDVIKFQNREYKLREIELPEVGSVSISTANLNNALMNNGNNYVSKEAQSIDEEVYFFVEENEIELNDVDLINLISSQVI